MKARRALLAICVAIAATPVTAQVPHAAETFDAVWQIIRDTHFDASMNGVDWNSVRDELRPRAVSARTSGQLRAVIDDMLGRLGQSHFALIPATADLSRGGVDAGGEPGFDVRLVGRDLLVTVVDPHGGAASAGVRTGWRLMAIDGTDSGSVFATVAAGMPERLLNLEVWRIVQNRLRGPQRSRVALIFEDAAGKPVTANVERRGAAGTAVTIGSLPTMYVRVESERRSTPAGASAGVIRFNVWMPAIDDAFQRAIDSFRTSTGIIIDLRGNPGGLAAMVMGIAGHFIAERIPLGVMKTRATELRFAANPRLVNARGERVAPFGGPVAILVDALTGSASECFAGGMQSLKRARVFGQTSMGQALPAMFDRLPNGDVLIHATGDFVTADGTRLEGRGVVPDEIVPLRRDDLLAGRDAPLEAALAWIDRASAGERTGSPPFSSAARDLCYTGRTCISGHSNHISGNNRGK